MLEHQGVAIEYGFEQYPALETSVGSVICVHGITRNRHDFEPLAERLARRFDTHVPDLVGHGDSAWLPPSLTYGADLFLAQLQHLISAKVTHRKLGYVGSSYGGLLGILRAAQPSSRIDCLVVNDAGPGIDRELYHRLAKLISYYPAFPSHDVAKHWVLASRRQGGAVPEQRASKLLEHAVRPLETGGYSPNYDPALPKLYVDQGAEPVEIWDAWERVTCPVLLIRGEHSQVLTHDMIGRMKSSHVGLEVIEIPGVGHFPHLMTEEQIAPVEMWLASHLRPASTSFFETSTA